MLRNRASLRALTQDEQRQGGGKKGTKVAKVSGREVGVYNLEAPTASFLGPKLTMPILAFLTGVFSE